VTAPAAPTRAACWTGPHGAASKCRQAEVANGVATFTQSGLGPHEALTVAVSIPKGVIAPPRPVLQERPPQAFALTPVSAGASGGLLAVLAIAGAVVLTRGRRRQYVVSAPGRGTRVSGL
jgi:hypothetical protein